MSEYYIPGIEEETCNGTAQVGLYTRHLKNRKVFLLGEINEEKANHILAQFMYLSSLDEEKEISLYINSPGGEVNAGLIIYDVMQGMKTPVNVYCIGRAASMGAVILAGGRKGRRFILPHSKTMIHEPLISNGVGGSATSIRHISESILETKKIINEILAEHTGKTEEEIDRATSYDNYMNAEESVAFGLCDRIVSDIL